MRIGILTQPLHSNYGGVLQNYALQQVLEELGHTTITIDQKKKVSLIKYLLSTLKTILLRIFGKKRDFIKYTTLTKRNKDFDKFVNENITITSSTGRLYPKIVKANQIEALVVGSDQVWRPRYNKGRLQDMFLSFAKEMDVRRVAYAASFGVDTWEYDKSQEKQCAELAQRFDAISVREESGITLCDKYLGVTAKKVLDPTLLLSRNKYEALCSSVRKTETPFIFAYVLDLTPEKQMLITEVVKSKGFAARVYSADSKASLSLEQWLSMFRDASFVVTDSFHGTCFSIIFEKDFYTIGNKHRGTARFMSLLSGFDLQNRHVDLSFVNQISIHEPIDWNVVRQLLAQQSRVSIEFLKDSLK